MGPVNTRVVRRSHALMGHPYGPEFRYDEAIAFPNLPTAGAWAAANATAAAIRRHHGRHGPAHRCAT